MNWLLLNSGPGATDLNMALDEALLERAPAVGKPVLRFYGWVENAASFGYFQRYEEVARATLLRPLVRRPTGGGLVLHDADWTYCLAFPAGHEWHALRAEVSYRRVHEWLRAAFGLLGVKTDLAPSCKNSLPGQCFVGHEKFDLLWEDRKIAGAAQRRTRDGLLIQGSVQPPPFGPARQDWENAVCDAARSVWNVDWEPFEPDATLVARAMELRQSKYSQTSYNQKR